MSDNLVNKLEHSHSLPTSKSMCTDCRRARSLDGIGPVKGELLPSLSQGTSKQEKEGGKKRIQNVRSRDVCVSARCTSLCFVFHPLSLAAGRPPGACLQGKETK